MMARTRRNARVALPILLLALATAVHAQDGNYLIAIDSIEARLRSGQLNVIDHRGSRAQGDRTMRITLSYPDETTLIAKLAKAPYGGGEFNNEPRYELAAFEIQRLFFEPDEYVVPPTVVRAVPLDWLRQYDSGASRTFDQARQSVVIVLQYWLLQVSPENFYDRDRARTDTVYARYLGNFNILTHLIRHNDANTGNFLLSQSSRPRVFSVDNGVAFESEVSNRGYEWRNIRVERLPHATIERLRAITPESLRETLGVLVQFRIENEQLLLSERTENLDRNRGVRRRDSIVQFGLTEREIRGVENRIRELLEKVDKGDIVVF
jgi:hypothetical protein